MSDYRLDEWGSIPGRSKGFFSLASVSRPAVETHPASYAVGIGGKEQPEREADHSFASSAEIKND
jgi:hypothetical protein